MNLDIGSIVFICLSLAYLAIRVHFKCKFASVKKIHRCSGLLDKGLVVLITLGQGGVPGMYLFTPVLNWSNYRAMTGQVLFGSVIYVLGLWMFWLSHRDLDSNWSVILELSENHTVITDGIYSHIRHPMYAAFFVISIGQGLLLPNWVAGFSGFFSTVALYILRVPEEERMMMDAFGQAYADYRNRTGGIIPKIMKN